MTIAVLFFLFCFDFGQSYNANNVDTESAIVLKNPFEDKNHDAYFGYSIALAMKDGLKDLYVGAPRDQIHGNVFKCSLLNPKDPTCSRMIGKLQSQNNVRLFWIDKKFVVLLLVTDSMQHKNRKNLFGMTVSAFNGKVVSCAHLEPIDENQTKIRNTTGNSTGTSYVSLQLP